MTWPVETKRRAIRLVVTGSGSTDAARETGVPEGTIRRWVAELTHEQPTRGMLTGYLWEALFQGGITQGQARAMRILQRILMDDDLPDVDALDELLGDG